MEAPGFYQPVPRGLEIRIAEKLQQLHARNAQALDIPVATAAAADTLAQPGSAGTPPGEGPAGFPQP